MPKDDTPRNQVLDDVSETPEIAGMSQVGLVGFFFPTLACWFIIPAWFPSAWTPVLLALGILWLPVAVIAITATPSHLSAGQYIRIRIRWHIQQSELIHE